MLHMTNISRPQSAKIMFLSIFMSSDAEESESGSVAEAEGTTGRRTTSNRRHKGALSAVVQPAKRQRRSKFICHFFRGIHRIVDWTWSDTLFAGSVSHIFIVLCSQRGALP